MTQEELNKILKEHKNWLRSNRKDKNKTIQCAIDFGCLDTDTIKRLIRQQTIINREV